MRRALLCIFLALALSLVHADTTTRTFTNYYGSAPLAYITTDLEANPGLSAPDYACVGSSITPTAQIYTDWYSSVYDSKLKSNANLQSCLTPSSAVNQNQPISWLTSSNYQCIFGTGTPTYFGDYATFTSFMSGCGVSNPPDIIEKSQYYDTNGVPYSGFYKAGIGAYCNGNVSVNSTGSYSFNAAYTGANPTLPSLTSSAPADISLQIKLSTFGCGATSHAYVSSACYGDTVYKHVNTTAPNFVAWSATKTVHFRYPFACNLSALSFSPMSMNNSTTYNFNLVIKNNGDSVNVTSITLAAGSQFTNLVIGAPTLPYTFAAGAQATFSGTVKSPAATGMLPLTLNINSVSTAPNCTGSTANCNLQASFMINVTAPPPPVNNTPASCTLAFDNHATTFTPVDSAYVNATCRANNNAIVPCGQLSWSTTAASGSMAPPTTTSPSRSQLTVNGVSAPQTNAIVKAQNGTIFNCTILFNVVAPDYIPLLSAPAQVQVNTQFTANITTKDIGAATNISTYTMIRFPGLTHTFNVSQLTQQGIQSDSYIFTCPPTPNLYELNATVDLNNQLNESNESNNFATMMVNCTAAPPLLKPDYISSISAPSQATVGTTFSISVTTTNIGTAAATASSTTQLNVTGYAPKNFTVRALGANGDSVVNTTTATCPGTPTALTLKSFADLYNQTNESNRLNNNYTATVNCVASANKPNYYPKISMPVVFLNIPFIANFSTKNIGTAPATVSSTTHVTFPGTVHDFFPVVPLPVGGEQNDSFDFVCTSPTALMNETVDYYNVINESDETDNSDARLVTCYTPPNSCTLNFTGPDFPPFGTYDSSNVAATCFASGVQTACPPFLWQQSAQGGFMSPINTPGSWSPNSTLTLYSALTPQIGMHVNATSTLSGVQLSCSLPFDISNTPIGPDYIVTAIQPDHPTSAIGQVVQFTVTVFNQGNVNATNDSTSTAVFSPGCEIITNRDSYFLPHINAQDSDISVNDLACTCRVAGTQNITVFANPTHAQNETNFNNNDRTQAFICQPPFPTITCSYFV